MLPRLLMHGIWASCSEDGTCTTRTRDLIGHGLMRAFGLFLQRQLRGYAQGPGGARHSRLGQTVSLDHVRMGGLLAFVGVIVVAIIQVGQRH
jgi:hypothetical protein